MDIPATPTRSAQRPRVWLLAAAMALVVYGIFLARHCAAVAGGSDSSGYMNQARLLAEGHVRAPMRPLPGLSGSDLPAYLYSPLGFKPADSGKLAPTYPTGFALLVLAARGLFGWEGAARAVVVFHALAGLLLTALLCRRVGLSTHLSLLAATVTAASPLYLFISLQAMSDVPSLVWTTAAVLLAMESRKQPLWGLLAGFCLGVDVLLRPTNVLALFPVALALSFSRRRWLMLVLGGLPAAVFLLSYNREVYGGMLVTGYGNNARDFGLSLAPATALHYFHWLPLLFSPLVVAALAFPFLKSIEGSTRTLLASWFLIFAAFYGCYQCTHETWWYLRFLLPALPALLAASLLAFEQILMGFLAPRRRLVWAIAGLACLGIVSWQWSQLRPLSVSDDERRYEQVGDWVKSHVPPNAACVCMQASGAVFYYTDCAVLRWDFIDPATAARIRSAAQQSHVPIYAVLFPFEMREGQVLEKRLPGHWIQVASVRDVTLWRLDMAPPLALTSL